MNSPWIEGVRSVALNVPDLTAAEKFYTQVWNLDVTHRTDSAIYLSGIGTDGYLLALHQGGDTAQIRHLTLRARSEGALAAIGERVEPAGGSIVQLAHPLTRDPAGGIGLKIRDPHGRIFQIVYGDSKREVGAAKDKPQRIAHIVLNSHAIDETQAFITNVLGFTLADRTVALAFMNCNSDHHSLAVGVADNDALNHIAFVMPDADAVMRGAGRMKDAGFPIQWGPGRHGPGNNLFNYFIDPFGVVIEYTAEVQQVDDSYVARGPDDWKWAPGRTDQWGISAGPGPLLKEAQRRVFFAQP